MPCLSTIQERQEGAVLDFEWSLEWFVSHGQVQGVITYVEAFATEIKMTSC